MSDAWTQTLKNEVAEIERRMEANRPQANAIAAKAVSNGLMAILAAAALAYLALVAVTGYGAPITGSPQLIRLVAGGLALALLVLNVALWRAQFTFAAEVMSVPGWSRDEMRRLKDLKRRLNTGRAEAGR